MKGDLIAPDAGPEEVCAAFGVSRESCAKLRIYADELARWSPRVNLVSRKTLPQLWTRHVADSLQLIPLLGSRTRRIIDLGSGGGAPGLVLALALAEERDIHIFLVESVAKKAAFLRSVAQKAGVRVTVLNARIEDVDPAAAGCDSHTVVTARALAPMPELVELAAPFLQMGAQGLFLKGQDVGKELTQATRYWKIDAEQFPSRTDSAGTIVRIREIKRV